MEPYISSIPRIIDETAQWALQVIPLCDGSCNPGDIHVKYNVTYTVTL